MLKEPNIGKEAAQGLLGLVSAYGRGDVSTMMKNVTSFYKKATKGDAAQEKSLKTKTSPADVVMWSGSKDEQKSYVADCSCFLSFPSLPYQGHGHLIRPPPPPPPSSAPTLAEPTN